MLFVIGLVVRRWCPTKYLRNQDRTAELFYSRTNTVATTESIVMINLHVVKNLHPSLSSPDLWDYDEDDANSDYILQLQHQSDRTQLMSQVSNYSKISPTS